MPMISVLTPSIRPEGLLMVQDCLEKQSFQDFEWLISVPKEQKASLRIKSDRVRVFEDPPKREGDFYCLNKAWNRLALAAWSPLLVFACDWSWFGPDALSLFLENWKDSKETELDGNIGISAVVNHYRWRPTSLVGRPEVLWLSDPRLYYLSKFGARDQNGELLSEIPAHLMEFALAMLPTSKYLAAGGLDESFDRFAGNSEKDLCIRLAENDMSFFLESNIECRSWTHPREHTKAEWDLAFDRSQQAMSQRYSLNQG